MYTHRDIEHLVDSVYCTIVVQFFMNLNLLIFLWISFSGCRSKRDTRLSPTSRSGVKSELFIGGTITAPEMDNFLKVHVDPLFPGFTVLEGSGRWQGRAMPSKIIVVLHEGTEETNSKIECIRTSVKTQFHHQSVSRIDTTSFYELYIPPYLSNACNSFRCDCKYCKNSSTSVFMVIKLGLEARN